MIVSPLYPLAIVMLEAKTKVSNGPSFEYTFVKGRERTYASFESNDYIDFQAVD